jgi:hypothetical protein
MDETAERALIDKIWRRINLFDERLDNPAEFF